VAEIRNMFAHKHLALDFGDSTIRKTCEGLQAWRILLHGEKEELPAEPSPKQMHMRARNQFKISVVLIGSRIHVDALGKREQSKKP